MPKSYLLPTLYCVLVWQMIPLLRFAYDNTVFVTLIRICCVLGIVFFLLKSIALYQKNRFELPAVFFILCFYSIVLILALIIPIYKNGLYDTVFLNIQNKFGMFSFLAPYMALYKFHKSDLRKLKILALFLCPFEVFICWYVFRDISPASITNGVVNTIDPTTDSYVELRKWLLLIFPGIKLQILFCLGLFRKDMKYSIVFFSVFLLYFYLVVVGGSRGTSIICTILFSVVILGNLYMRQNKTIKITNLIISGAIAFVIIASGFVALLLSESNTFEYLKSRTFFEGNSTLELQDSHRDDLVDDLIKDFNEKPSSWIVGRGIHGEYYSDSFLSDRNVIEYGFLQLILNGGVGLLIVYWLTLILGIKKGLSANKSKQNIYFVVIVLLLVVRLIEQISYGIPEFSLNDYILWYLFGLLFQPVFTNMTTQETIDCINRTDDTAALLEVKQKSFA